jgi:thiol-disulfide isomerase/thioredoxin
VHDQTLLVTEARLAADVGITRRISLGVMLPVRVVSTGITYLDADGMEVTLVNDGIHHRDETVSGIADPMLLGAVTERFAGVRWTARAGFTVPIGRTEEDPFVNEDVPHQHIQMGTGTVNPVIAVEAVRAAGVWSFGGFAMTQQVLYENSKGYQAGDRYAGGVMARRGLGDAWSVRGGVEVQAETAERWQGVVHTDDGNQGRVDVMLVGGASWAATRALSVDLAVKVPVVTHVVGGQLDMPAVVEIGAAWSFGGKAQAESEEEEHHEHEEADTTGVDVADATEVAPVPGKFTIVDFWATWCEPCKHLEPALVDIAREHGAAVRRIDMSDGDMALPHVKVFDPDGKLVLEKTAEAGKLDELIDAVHDAVDVDEH